MTIAFGVDPGSHKCGWGVVRFDGQKLYRIASGVIKKPKSWPLYRRFGAIAVELDDKVNYHLDAIDAFGCENTFVGNNAKTALVIGSARGIVMVAAARAGLPFELFEPTTVKKAVSGNGHATKDQVQYAVRVLLGIVKPFKEEPLLEDESDALAVAICAAMSFRVKEMAGRV